MNPPEECSSIEEVRLAIDTIDQEIIGALSRRFAYVKTITRFKRTEEEIQAPARFAAVIESRRAWAQQAGLEPDVIEQMYRHLIAHFIDVERAELNSR
ncbi:MAG: chorismate mutase [Caldilineaceae bacterium]